VLFEVSSVWRHSFRLSPKPHYFQYFPHYPYILTNIMCPWKKPCCQLSSVSGTQTLNSKVYTYLWTDVKESYSCERNICFNLWNWCIFIIRTRLHANKRIYYCTSL
jgi:hypothetical protein